MRRLLVLIPLLVAAALPASGQAVRVHKLPPAAQVFETPVWTGRTSDGRIKTLVASAGLRLFDLGQDGSNRRLMRVLPGAERLYVRHVPVFGDTLHFTSWSRACRLSLRTGDFRCYEGSYPIRQMDWVDARRGWAVFQSGPYYGAAQVTVTNTDRLEYRPVFWGMPDFLAAFASGGAVHVADPRSAPPAVLSLYNAEGAQLDTVVIPGRNSRVRDLVQHGPDVAVVYEADTSANDLNLRAVRIAYLTAEGQLRPYDEIARYPVDGHLPLHLRRIGPDTLAVSYSLSVAAHEARRGACQLRALHLHRTRGLLPPTTSLTLDRANVLESVAPCGANGGTVRLPDGRFVAVTSRPGLNGDYDATTVRFMRTGIEDVGLNDSVFPDAGRSGWPVLLSSDGETVVTGAGPSVNGPSATSFALLNEAGEPSPWRFDHDLAMQHTPTLAVRDDRGGLVIASVQWTAFHARRWRIQRYLPDLARDPDWGGPSGPLALNGQHDVLDLILGDSLQALLADIPFNYPTPQSPKFGRAVWYASSPDTVLLRQTDVPTSYSVFDRLDGESFVTGWPIRRYTLDGTTTPDRYRTPAGPTDGGSDARYFVPGPQRTVFAYSPYDPAAPLQRLRPDSTRDGAFEASSAQTLGKIGVRNLLVHPEGHLTLLLDGGVLRQINADGSSRTDFAPTSLPPAFTMHAWAVRANGQIVLTGTLPRPASGSGESETLAPAVVVIDPNRSTAESETERPLTEGFIAHPQPMRGSATVRFAARSDGPARLDLFDLLGRRVATLHDAPVRSGESLALPLDASALAPGAYLLRLVDGSGTRSLLVRKTP